MARAILLCSLVASASAAALMGIDFGHEFMKVSLVKPGMPFQVISNFQSKRKTPPLVAFYERERLFGADADSLSGRKPHLVLTSPHKVLGRNASHPLVEEHTGRAFPAVAAETNARGGISFVLPHADAVARPGAEVAEAVPVAYTAEEVTAMLLAHAADFASHVAETRVTDAVICVHSYLTQNERQAILDAADLAGLRVTALLDENVGAAIQYGIDRVFDNGTHYMILYNMGGEATQVTLLAYDAYNASVGGKVRAVGQGRVLAKAWDLHLGGRHLDRAIMNWAAEKFNADKGKHLPKSANGDIRNVPTAMSKLRKTVVRTKEILSANEEFQLYVEGILPDVDFRATLSRKQFEEIADKAGLLQRITAPIESVLTQANISLSDVAVVEIIGGSVRVPKVQAILRDYLTARSSAEQPVALGQHMNGDDSMALGAAFLAANRSSLFRVRKVGMIDGFPFAIGTRVTHLHPSASAPTGGDAGDELQHDAEAAATTSAPGAAGKAWSKRSALFRTYSQLETTKRITFSTDKDLRAVLYYEVPNANAPQLPDGVSRTLAFYNITGIDELLKDEKMAALGVPKIHLAFELDIHGIAKLTRAEATLEEEYIPTPTPTPTPSATPDAAAGDAAEAEATPAPAASATANATAPEAPLAPRKRTHKFPLTVTVDTAAALVVQPVSAEERALSIATLKHLNKLDQERRAWESAKNALEAYIYAARDRMSSNEDQLPSVSTEEQREAITTGMSEHEDWLYGDGASATVDEFKAKLKALKAVVEPVFHRLSEFRGRPALLNDTRSLISTSRAVIKTMAVTHPQVTSNETADLEAAISAFEAWFEALVMKQADTAAHEAPVLTKDAVQLRWKAVADQLSRLLKKPKPTPTPTPAPKVTVDNNSTDANSTASDSASSEGGDDQPQAAEGAEADDGFGFAGEREAGSNEADASTESEDATADAAKDEL